ncbi:MAG: hypothetical protein WC375_03520, partial [Methanomassiliicoccales archaeon]
MGKDLGTGAIAKKRTLILGAVVVAIIVIAAIFVPSMLESNEPEPVEYTGMIVPTSTITGNSYDVGFQFTGRPTDDDSASIETFEISASTEYGEIVGGTFMIKEGNGLHSIDSVVDA